MILHEHKFNLYPTVFFANLPDPDPAASATPSRLFLPIPTVVIALLLVLVPSSWPFYLTVLAEGRQEPDALL